MPTPKSGYRLKNGEKVPGTTTIIGRFKDAGPLMFWANQQGLEGNGLNDARDTAATIGTIAHQMVDDHIHGRQFQAEPAWTTEMVDKARTAFCAYLTWAHYTRLTIVATEMALVSEQHRYGGTPDAIGEIDGELILIDWKTSNGVYGEQMIPQLAAYIHLWNENYPDRLITGGAHLLRFSKQAADFSHHYFADVADGFEAFLHMRALYSLVKTLSNRTR